VVVVVAAYCLVTTSESKMLRTDLRQRSACFSAVDSTKIDHIRPSNVATRKQIYTNTEPTV